MKENKKPQNKKKKKSKFKHTGLDIDKAEYQEIVLSQSNNTYKGYYNYK